MSESASPPPTPEPTAAPPGERKRPSSWIIGGLLVLLAAWFVVTQVIQRTGPAIEWVRDDFPRAEQLARESDRLVFLLLHEPGCAVTAANERDLFSRRAVRELLAETVCCRVELQPDDLLRRRFYFRDQPLMLVLEPGRDSPLMRPLEGKVNWLEFKTVVEAALAGRAE